MRNLVKYRSLTITFTSILLCTLFFTRCINSGTEKQLSSKAPAFNQFAGSASCANCHKNIYSTHINTAHFHTSEIASAKNIMGSFDTGKNTFVFNNGATVAMEKRPSGFFQVAYINGAETKSQRFDITIGSGTKGQSYATWAGQMLLQLPITYFTSADQWCNSPGYPNKVAFNRPITSRCLECHATFATTIPGNGKEPEKFDSKQMIWGVDCEKCHGPAAQHVAYQTENPNEKKGKFIINPASFTRQQSLDLCALCHGGRLQKSRPSFQFTAGDKLADYFLIDSTAKDVNGIDVHGNQSGLLTASRCFLKSNTLTCVTCHNTHENEKGKTALFSQRCTGCHNNKHADALNCKMTASIGSGIENFCTACHMPQQPSMAIAVLLPGKGLPTPATMHTHLIKVYPEETQKILAYIKQSAGK